MNQAKDDYKKYKDKLKMAELESYSQIGQVVVKLYGEECLDMSAKELEDLLNPNRNVQTPVTPNPVQYIAASVPASGSSEDIPVV